MEKISISEQGLSTMCRLCLSKNGTLIEMFTFSPDLKDSIANAVCKCASIHIKRNDELPNYICRLCYIQLIKTHQFQSKAMQSDKTLRCYLQQLRKQSEPKNSVLVDRGICCSKFDVNYCTKTNATTSKLSMTYSKEDELLKDHDCVNIEMKTSNLMNTIKESIETKVGLTDKIEESDFTDSCNESNVDLEDKKTILLDSKSDLTENLASYSLKSSTDFFVKCELQFNENLVKEKNIKQENEERLNNDSSVNIYESVGDQKILSVKKEQLSERKDVGRRSYQCDVCNKCFIWLSYLKRHKRTHTDEKPYQCDVCKKCFNQLRNLNTHKLTHTGEKPYQCEICSECFVQLGNLNRHKLTHTGEKPYRCDICFKTYTQSSHLNTHKLTHTGEKPYQCDICNKCFTRSSHLNTHKFTHTGEKPYQCNVCNKCFTRLKTLKTHKLTHTGEKSYQCEVCSKCFTYSSTLNSHKSIHTGEKPFQCDVCKKCFNHSSNLRKHKLTHTGDG